MGLSVVAAQTPAPPPPPVPSLDPNFVVSELAPLLGIFGLAIVAGLALRWFFRSPLAEALAERVRVRTQRRFGEVATDAGRVAGLEQQVAALQDQLSELAERVDFAERLLAERRERKLSAGQ